MAEQWELRRFSVDVFPDFPCSISCRGDKGALCKVSSTRDLLGVLLDIALECEDSLEEAIGGLTWFVEDFAEVDPEDLHRGVVAPEDAPRWFVDYDSLVATHRSHEACHALVDVFERAGKELRYSASSSEGNSMETIYLTCISTTDGISMIYINYKIWWL